MDTLRAAPYVLRYAFCALALVIFLLAMYRLSFHLVGQVHEHQAATLFREGYYGLALGRLEQARLVRNNDYEIYASLGEVYFKLGGVKPSAKEAWTFLVKSKEAYARAADFNPLDAQSAYGMARAAVHLNELHGCLHPEEKATPFHPDVYFAQAIRLRPNGIHYHYAYARYLYGQGREEELVAVIHNLSRIYPPSYDHLRRETFWSPDVKKACEEGLKAALLENTMPRAAHAALSSIMAREQQWPAAILHYEEALRHRTFENRAENHLHLGSLYLKNGQFEEARIRFLRAINMSRSKGQIMAQIYGLYKSQQHSDRFEQLYREADRMFIFPAGTEMLLARSLFDLKQTFQAQRILTELVQKRPNGEAYYWLGRIFESDGDWDQMELSIQKATVLEPKNSRYRLLFSQVLQRMKKVDRALAEADLAVQYESPPSPWTLNHRAWIRWAKKDYPGALQDWTKAIGIHPESASLNARAAEAHAKLGHFSAAIKQYEKAMKLDPENASYVERRRELEKQAHQRRAE